jgi:hypothetical protein
MQAVAFSSTFGGGKRVLSQKGRLLTLTSINSGRRGKIFLDQSSYLLHLITIYSLGGACCGRELLRIFAYEVSGAALA